MVLKIVIIHECGAVICSVPSVCLCPVCAVTFESLDLVTSFFGMTVHLGISKSCSCVKSQGHGSKKTGIQL